MIAMCHRDGRLMQLRNLHVVAESGSLQRKWDANDVITKKEHSGVACGVTQFRRPILLHVTLRLGSLWMIAR